MTENGNVHTATMSEQMQIVLDCLAVYMGDYAPEKQYAACIMLKMCLGEKTFKRLMDVVKEETGFRVNDRYSTEVTRWGREVKRAGKCEICGSTEHLEAHHKIPWQYSIKGRTDIENGQCLCSNCHHRIMHDDMAWIDYMRRCRDG